MSQYKIKKMITCIIAKNCITLIKMKFASFFITIALLFSSCEKPSDPSPQQEGEQTVKTVNRIEQADAPSLEPDLVHFKGFRRKYIRLQENF